MTSPSYTRAACPLDTRIISIDKPLVPTADPPPTPSHPLLDRLWKRYVADVPYAATVARLHGRPFENDHVALRTIAPDPAPDPARDPAGGTRGGIDMFARVFESLGWKRAGAYTFPDVHLRAIHLSQPGLPRIFVSELDVTALPAGARAILSRHVDEPAPHGALSSATEADALAAWFRAPARVPDARELDEVARVSQYGAWVLAFGRKVNHFTAAVDDVDAWQQKLIDAGVPMKSEIEGARGGPLRQTATHAVSLDITLADGSVRQQPYAYVEIAQRAPGFDGFLAPQARQLFDMTAT